MYTNVKYTPTDVSKIEVYSTTTPKKEYIELAEITSLLSGRELKEVTAEAARLGADAVIPTGPGRLKIHLRGRGRMVEKQLRYVAIKFK
ncbi:hypothetical protein AGMMS49936_00220 [Endomicrobiia bacterium]|nr:hypothetical protein AGMMS49936_00220 [Endomicrobiia bacterium]